MPKKRKDEDSVFLRGLSPYKDFIAAMEKDHKVLPVELGRGLFAAAHAFWKEHGFFSFPVRIEPDAFQQKWLAAEGRQGGYEPSPTAVIEAEEASRRYDAERKKEGRRKRGAEPRKPSTGAA